MWKKSIDDASFFYFFHNTGPNLAQILHQDHTHFFSFFAGFQWSMLEDSINIYNIICNTVVLKKKIGKTSKNYHFWAQLVLKGVTMGHLQNKKQLFLTEITKQGQKPSKTFYFIKISYGLVELWILFCVVLFLLKRVISSQLRGHSWCICLQKYLYYLNLICLFFRNIGISHNRYFASSNG